MIHGNRLATVLVCLRECGRIRRHKGKWLDHAIVFLYSGMYTLVEQGVKQPDLPLMSIVLVVSCQS